MLLLVYGRTAAMPCPLFRPTVPLPGITHGASPLGKRFDGCCDAAPLYVIPPELLRDGCNLGYARGKCDFAKQSQSDATTFVIARADNSSVLVRWALERDHLPVAVGEFAVADQPPTNPIEAQAAAYVSIYRERLS